MVSRFGGRFWIGLGVALACGASARAASVGTGTAASPLFATGDVEKDMPSSPSSGVTVIQGHPYNYVAEPDWMTKNGLINGYAMKDIRLSYDKNTDTLSVGVNFYGVAGNTDGSPDGQTNSYTLARGGSNPANYGADKSLTVAFTPVTPAGVAANPVIVAGVPAVKPQGGTTADKFTVAAYQASTGGVAHSYGQTMTDNLGSLAYNPSSATPDMEFTIKNFSKIPGLNALTNGFYLSAYSGSQQTVIVGKSDIANTFVAPLKSNPEPLLPVPNLPRPPVPITPPPPVPEPTTVLAWGLVAGGAAWRVRRAGRRSQS